MCAALHMGIDWVKANMEYPIGLPNAPARTPVGDRIFIEGNAARSPGRCLWWGDGVARGIRSRRPRHWPRRSSATHRPHAGSIRRREKNKFAIVQAEDELASIGMVIGASWNGAPRVYPRRPGPEFR